jgi:hypothetical protein
MIFMFILMCKFSIVSKYDKWIEILSLEFFTIHFEVQILVIWNNLEYGVLMNCKVKCIDNQVRNCECMHVEMQICCYNSVEWLCMN